MSLNPLNYFNSIRFVSRPFLSLIGLAMIVAPDVALSAPSVWTVPSLERIGMSSAPSTNVDVQLYAARGEVEAFQIAVRSLSDDLTNVTVTISDLVDSAGNRISNTNVEVYREHYVYVDSPSIDSGGTNPPLGEGWYADGLIPLEATIAQQDAAGFLLDAGFFDVEANRTQPFWVDIFVPRDSKPGKYTATFTVWSDQGQSSGEISLNVWDFELPLKPLLNTVFGFHGEQTKQASEELLRHRINPQFHSSPQLDLQRGLIDTLGLQSVNLGFWSGGENFNCQMTTPPSVAEVVEATAYHEEDLFKYVYSADEIGGCTNLYESVKSWGRTLHDAGVDNLVVMPPTPELFDDGSGTGRSAVDIWVILPSEYEENIENILAALAKGDQVWSYNALVQDNYSPKWQIDFSPINLRVQPGFINQSLGLTGLLYWRVDGWTDAPWNDVTTFVDRGNRSYSGDGMLVYPGEPLGLDGILPSMRLKWLRDGIEDYDYIELLKQLGKEDQALALSNLVGRDWKTWTKESDFLESVRLELGNEIERLTQESSAATQMDQ